MVALFDQMTELIGSPLLTNERKGADLLSCLLYKERATDEHRSYLNWIIQKKGR